MKLWKNILSLIVGNGTTQVINFAFLIIIVRAYDQLDYSIYKQGNLLLATILPFLIFGVPISLSYYIPRNNDARMHNRNILNAVVVMLVTGGAGGAVLALFSTQIAEAYNNPDLSRYMWCYGSILLAETVFSFYPYCLVALNHARRLAVETAAFAIIRIVTLLICIVCGFSMWTLTVFLLLNSLLKMGYVLRFTLLRFQKHGVQWDRRTFLEQSWFSIPLGLSIIIYSVMTVLDKNLVSMFYDPIQFTVYANGVYNIPFIGILTGSVSSALLPSLASMYDSSDQSVLDASIQLWHKTIIATSALMIPLVFVMFTFARELVLILFTKTYIEAVPIFQIFLLVMLTKITYFGNLLTVAKKQLYLVISSILGVVSLVIAFVVLHASLGFTYVVWAVVIANFVLAFSMLWQIKWTFNQSISNVYPWSTTLVMGVVCLSVMLVVQLVKSYLGLTEFPSLVALGMPMYALCVLLCVLFNGELRMMAYNLIWQNPKIHIFLQNLKHIYYDILDWRPFSSYSFSARHVAGLTAHPNTDPSSSKSTWIQFFLVLYLITQSGVMFFTDDKYLLADIGLVVVMVVYMLGKGVKIAEGHGIMLGAVIMLITGGAFIHRDASYETNIAIVVTFLLTFLIVYIVPFDLFRKYFVAIIVTLAAFSLFFVFAESALREYYLQAPIITNTNIAHYHNLGVWLYRVEAPDRNTGVFWEPGAFQAFLNLSLLFVLFDGQIKRHYKIALSAILVLTIVTTYSTTGYIVCTLVFTATLIENLKTPSPRNVALVLIGMLLIIQGFQTFVIDDERISSKFQKGEKNYGSFEDRLNASMVDVELMINAPVFGVGVGSYMEKREEQEMRLGRAAETTPNTYSGIGALFGLLFLIFYLAHYFKFCRLLTKNPVPLMLIFSGVFLMFSTESFIYLKLSHFFFWYGLILQQTVSIQEGTANELTLSQAAHY